MRLFPIIPIWIMLVICIIMILIILKNNKKNFGQIAIVILLFLINIRIMIPSNKSLSLTNNLDVLFVIDNTISMNALDYNGSDKRLMAVKEDCKFIINKLNGARFSIITFNNTAKVIIPYTKDINLTIESVDIIEPISELFAKGSSLNMPIETIMSSLKSSLDKEDRISLIFFISDGEITDNSSLESYKDISKYIKNGAVLGYGTNKGGYMIAKDRFTDNEEYIMDYDNSFEKAISKIDENNLKKIANDMNVEYIHMEKQNNINKKLEEIKKMINNNLESNDKSSYEDTYYFLVWPLLILIIIEFNKLKGKTI